MDVPQLADVLENFVGKSTQQYGINPLHTYSLPGYTWKAGLKLTNVKLDFMKIGPSGAQYYFCFNLYFLKQKKSLIKESYLEYQYTLVQSLFSAQLHVITVQVYTAFNSSRTKENIKNITTKRRRSFAFVFECRRSSPRTNN